VTIVAADAGICLHELADSSGGGEQVVSCGTKLKKNKLHGLSPQANHTDRLCGLVVKVSGYRYRGPGSIPGTTRFFLRSSGSGTGSTQPRDDN
jgi:hypothetical protein